MGVCIGLLTTAVVQSSSFTTSMLVGLVATTGPDGQALLSLPQAIPVVMGANIGTTITNNFVASAHLARRHEFRLAFSGGTIHDIFNMLTVILLLPIEILFHPLQKIATALTAPVQSFFTSEGGQMSKGPVDAVIQPVVHGVENGLRMVSDNTTFLGVALLVVALILLFIALTRMVVVLRQVFMGGVESIVNELLFKRWWTAFLFGAIATALVQSSSLTVSLIVPMVASGILTVERAFPFTVGANVGTTITAFLAAVVLGAPAGIALAVAHLFFNLVGGAVFLPLRKIPVFLSKKLADQVYKRRWFALVYIGVLFFLIPITIIVTCRLLAQ
jgi:sodium-dependent phosphate cotransporter